MPHSTYYQSTYPMESSLPSPYRTSWILSTAPTSSPSLANSISSHYHPPPCPNSPSIPQNSLSQNLSDPIIVTPSQRTLSCAAYTPYNSYNPRPLHTFACSLRISIGHPFSTSRANGNLAFSHSIMCLPANLSPICTPRTFR